MKYLKLKLLAALITLFAFSTVSHAGNMRGFGEYLQREITQVETALDEGSRATDQVEMIEGLRLSNFRLLLQALFGWKFPGFISLTVYPQIELIFDHVPVNQ